MSVEVLSSGGYQVLLIGHGCTAPSFSVGACGVLDEVACVHRVAFASRFHLVQKVSQLQCGQAVLGLGELLIGALAVVEHALGAAEVNAREACLGLLDGYLQFGVGQRNLPVGVLRCVYTDGLVVHVERNVVRSGGHAPVAVAVVAVAGVCHARDELQVGHAAAVASFVVVAGKAGSDTEVAHAVAALIEGELTRVDAVALVHEACLHAIVGVLAQHLPAAVFHHSIQNHLFEPGGFDGFEAYPVVLHIEIHLVLSAHALEYLTAISLQCTPFRTAWSDESSLIVCTFEHGSCVVLIEEQIHAVAISQRLVGRHLSACDHIYFARVDTVFSFGQGIQGALSPVPYTYQATSAIVDVVSEGRCCKQHGRQ